MIKITSCIKDFLKHLRLLEHVPRGRDCSGNTCVAAACEGYLIEATNGSCKQILP